MEEVCCPGSGTEQAQLVLRFQLWTISGRELRNAREQNFGRRNGDEGGKAMIANKRFGRLVLSGGTMFFALTLLGCIVAAVPLIIYATRGSSTSTATVLIDRDAATVYANAVKVVNQRGFTQIAKRDDAKYFLEGTRKGKNATLQVIPVGSNQSRVIITIETDKDATGINEAVEGLVQTCRQLGFQCEEQKS
jgi:hypothetical protein